MWKLYSNCSNELVIARTFFRRKLCSSRKSSELPLDQGYVPHKVGGPISGNDYFKPPLNDSKPFTMILPPPNITGTLHLGHALTATIEDVLIRWKTMQGIETVWVPGMDHAGIATQIVVEKNLWKMNEMSRHDIGREAFRKKVWEWKTDKAGSIWKQLQRLAVSLDWQREIFTLDEKHSKSVEAAFIKLFETGLIYRADRLVNWSCVLQSTISDIEIEHLPIGGSTNLDVPGYENPVEFGSLISFAYKVKDSDEEIIVATTRPETIIGDVAVAVHPDDQRFSRLVGRQLWHPFRKEYIPIVADKFVDPEFGTGAVKITPAHDKDDFDVGNRHKLPFLTVIDEGGHLTSVCGELQGTRRFDARKIIIDELAKRDLYRGKADHEMTVPICSRSRDIVELLVKSQWFIKSKEMADRAIEDVREGRLKIEPKTFENTWFNWLENIRDWCISRQLWWGHQIPAYRCYLPKDPEKCIWVAAENEHAAKEKAALKLGDNEITVTRDEDVLDTWFSSALLPMAVFGWPEQTDDLKRYYPLSLLETGHDIIFFWAARMVLLGTELMGKLPFNKVLLHGIVCDSYGRKMSKSLGNVITPEQVIDGITLQDLEEVSKDSHNAGILSKMELTYVLQSQKKMYPNGIPECGADALRFTLVSHNIKSHFINFDVNECYINKLFCNKIWQATRFTRTWFENVSKEQVLAEIKPELLGKMDRWALSRLSKMVDVVNESIENYDFHVATNALKNFLYYDFCDIYLESTKRGLRDSTSAMAAGHCFVLQMCLDVGLKALAPFMPILAKHLHQRLPLYPGAERTKSYPEKLVWHNPNLEKDIDKVMDLVIAIRRMKKLFNVAAKHNPEVYITGDSHFWNEHSTLIGDLASCHKVIVCKDKNQVPKGTVRDTVGSTLFNLIVPEDHKEKLKLDVPKMEVKREKLLNELAKINKMISGESYKTKAPIESQEAHSKKVTTLNDQISRIDYIKNLLQQD